MTIAAVLFDLRHFDPAATGAIERDHGLEIGTIDPVAFDPQLLSAVTVGSITNNEWVTTIGERIGSQAAARAWRRQGFVFDVAMIEEMRRLRLEGRRLAVLSNATDGLAEELVDAPILCLIEHLLNSAELGCAKPSDAAYQAAVDTLGLAPAAIAFVDDRLANVDAARRLMLRSQACASPNSTSAVGGRH